MSEAFADVAVLSAKCIWLSALVTMHLLKVWLGSTDVVKRLGAARIDELHSSWISYVAIATASG